MCAWNLKVAREAALGILILFFLWGPSMVVAQELFVSEPLQDNPKTFSAHRSQALCFVVGGTNREGGMDLPGDVVFLSMEGPKGEVGGKPGFADGTSEVCFMAPALENASEWKDCDPPRDEIKESYLITASLDSVGEGASQAKSPKVEIESLLINVTRTVERKNPKPEDCEELDGNWTWTFNSGVLECAKLPMKVPLPGFESAVVIETDGDSDTNGLKMTLTGGKTGDRLVLIREGDTSSKGKSKGKSYPTYQGYQDVSKLLEQRKPIKGKYTVYVNSSNQLQGNLDVDKMPYQGDVCSIFWPFSARRK